MEILPSTRCYLWIFACTHLHLYQSQKLSPQRRGEKKSIWAFSGLTHKKTELSLLKTLMLHIHLHVKMHISNTIQLHKKYKSQILFPFPFCSTKSGWIVGILILFHDIQLLLNFLDWHALQLQNRFKVYLYTYGSTIPPILCIGGKKT